MMLAAVHLGPRFPDHLAPRPFHPEKDVSGSCYLCSAAVVGRIVVPAVAGRFVHHSGWGHFVSCSDRQSLGAPSSSKLRRTSPAYKARQTLVAPFDRKV